MKYTFESNYGNFAYRLSADIETSEPVSAALRYIVEQGLANIAYRVAGSAVDKALGVKTKEGKRFDKRIEVLYSDADAEAINAAVSRKITELEGDAESGALVRQLHLSFSVTGQHSPAGGGGESKEAIALWTQVQGLPEEKFGSTMVKLGFTAGPDGSFDYDDASGVAACRRHIQKVKAEARKRQAEELGL